MKPFKREARGNAEVSVGGKALLYRESIEAVVALKRIASGPPLARYSLEPRPLKPKPERMQKYMAVLKALL